MAALSALNDAAWDQLTFAVCIIVHSVVVEGNQRELAGVITHVLPCTDGLPHPLQQTGRERLGLARSLAAAWWILCILLTCLGVLDATKGPRLLLDKLAVLHKDRLPFR